MSDSSFPDFITSRRRELELTLGDVAARLGVSPITVSNWSNGESRPRPENLVALAGLLEVPANELAEMAGISLAAPNVAVNLMPASDESSEPDDIDIDEPVAAAPMKTPEPDELIDEIDLDEQPVSPETIAEAEPIEIPGPEVDEVSIPTMDEDEPPVAAITAAEPEPEVIDIPLEMPAEDRPDSVPAFVAATAEAQPTARAKRRPSMRRPGPRPTDDDRPVTVLPLTYIEDPKQLLRYRIRWALTVVVLVIMFFILLWASRELLSALGEIKQAVTPGGIGGG